MHEGEGRTWRSEAVQNGHAAERRFLQFGERLRLLLDGIVLEDRLQRLSERRDRVVEACERRRSVIE